MKRFKQLLCVILSVLMAFSCLTLAASAQGTETVKPSLKYYSSKSDAYNAKLTLDKVDEILAGLNNGQGIYFVLVEDVLTVDLRNVNALCDTLDLLKRAIEVDNIFDIGTTALIREALGQLGDDINLKNWQENMSRTKDDIAILRNLLGFLGDNSAVIGGIVKGGYDMGLVSNFVDINGILGQDGISGMIKELLFGFVYKEGSADFNNAYNTYKNDVDAFIYGPLLSKLANDYLPGFVMDEESTIEEALILAFNISVDKYIADAVKKLNIDPSTSDNPALSALAGIVNLKGETYDLSGIKLDTAKPLLDQLNGAFGAIVNQIIPGFTGWVDGGYEYIGANIERVFKFVGFQSGLIPQAADMTLEEIVIEAVNVVLSSADLGSFTEGIADCDSIEEMLTAFLRNVSYDMATGVIYDDNDSYLVILGDMLADWAYSNFDIKDYSGKAYLPGGGKDIFEVANYLMNYFLFDKGVAKLMGLSTTKNESVFLKVDKILDYFGESKSEGVSFDSEEFLLGSDTEKGLLDAVFTYDIDRILELTIVPVLDNAGDVSAVEFLYKTVQYFLNNWAGKVLFPTYRQKAFTNALSNESLTDILSVALQTISAKKDAVVTYLTFLISLLIKTEDTVYSVTEADVDSCEATGTVLYPDGNVKLDGNTLIKGKDFIISVDSRVPGTAKAKIRFIGMYEGSVERNININLASVSKVSFLSNTSTVKLVWSKVPCADGYNIYILRNGNYEKLNTELITSAEFYINKLAAATEYSVKVEAVRNGYGAAEAKEIKVATTPAAVNVKTVKTLTDSTRARFVWDAVENATHYKLERYVPGSNKWVEELITDKRDVIVSGLDSYTAYTFRISALKKTGDGSYAVSTPVSVSVKTTLGAIKKTAVSYTSNSITIKWEAVKNAQKYQILQNVGGKWNSIAVLNASATSYKITGLKVATKYSFAVRPAVNENGKWLFGGHQIITQYTGLAKPKTFKVMATNATAAKIGWTAVANAKGYEVFQYKGGKWVSLGITKNTTVTINGLPSGTQSHFRVRAVTTVNGSYHYGDATSHITALTLPGKVTGLKATQRKQTSVKLAWNKVTGASGYQVFRLHNGKWVSLGTTTATSCTDTKALTKGTNYQYRVRAVQKVGSTYKYGAASDILKTSTPLLNVTLY